MLPRLNLEFPYSPWTSMLFVWHWSCFQFSCWSWKISLRSPNTWFCSDSVHACILWPPMIPSDKRHLLFWGGWWGRRLPFSSDSAPGSERLLAVRQRNRGLSLICFWQAIWCQMSCEDMWTANVLRQIHSNKWEKSCHLQISDIYISDIPATF